MNKSLGEELIEENNGGLGGDGIVSAECFPEVEAETEIKCKINRQFAEARTEACARG